MTNLSNKIAAGIHISILTSYATAHCALATQMVHGTIAEVRPKAIQILADCENGKQVSFWVPRKALVNDISKDDAISCRLAKWFVPQGWTARAMDLASHVSMLSA